MPTYVYESIPQIDDEILVRFEVKESLFDRELKIESMRGRRIAGSGFGIFFKMIGVSDIAGCYPKCD